MKIEELNKSIVDLLSRTLNLQKQVNSLTLSSGDSNVEVVQARQGEATLNDRLNKMEKENVPVGSIEEDFIDSLF